MFSAGIVQQIIRRQERMERALTQLEKGLKRRLEALAHISLPQSLPLPPLSFSHPLSPLILPLSLSIFSTPVQEVCSTLDEIQSSLEQCVPLLQSLNYALPEEERLETFKLHPKEEEEEDCGVGGDGDGDGNGETGGELQPPPEEELEGQEQRLLDEAIS